MILLIENQPKIRLNSPEYNFTGLKVKKMKNDSYHIYLFLNIAEISHNFVKGLKVYLRTSFINIKCKVISVKDNYLVLRTYEREAFYL